MYARDRLKDETIREIVLTNNNELLFKIAGSGNSAYQYIYREAAGVYWDPDQRGFKSTPIKEWTISEWFLHIRDLVRSSLGVELKIDEDLTWKNVPENEISKIKDAVR